MYIYIYYCLTTNNSLSSIAPFQTVLRTFRMLEMVHYVAIMRLFWVQNAVWLAVTTTRLLILKHVNNMLVLDRSIFILVVLLYSMVFDEYFNDHVNVKTGNLPLMVLQYNPTMKILLILLLRNITFLLITSTVLKQSVHFAELCLHGPSLLRLSHQLIFFNFWQQHSLLPKADLITSVLIRHAKSCRHHWSMDLRTQFGNIPVALLWIPIITTIIKLKYLLRDGLEIGMPAGTRSNHSASLLRYLINLILLLVRGESVAD